MFIANEHARVNVPVRLFGVDAGDSYYQLFERMGGGLVWIVKVMDKQDAEDEVGLWQTVFVSDPVVHALGLLSLERWAHRNLYVILPEYMTGSDRMTMALCLAIWRCEEPDVEQGCWVYETDAGTFVDSVLASELDAVKKKELLWSAAGVDVP